MALYIRQTRVTVTCLITPSSKEFAMNVKKRIALALFALLVVGCAAAATIQILLAFSTSSESILLQFNGHTITGATMFTTDLAWLPLVWATLALTAFVGFFIGAGVLSGMLLMLASLTLPFLIVLGVGFFGWKYRSRIAAKFA
jgi:hypothetical protein